VPDGLAYQPSCDKDWSYWERSIGIGKPADVIREDKAISWRELNIAYSDLKTELAEGRPTGAPWEGFTVAARQVFVDPPYHLVSLLTALKQAQGDRGPEEITILDHGCGGALTCLLLLANDYTGIFGVDVETSDCDKWNAFLRDQYGITEPRFFRYDGNRLPLDDGSIDFIFSQQVIEHVRPDVLDCYYNEEVRVLRYGGGAFHEVPHRLTPYDSHTRAWFLHFLPRELWLWLLENILKRDTATARQAIFLRWPWIHKNAARRAFGTLTDLTRKRLASKPDASVYDGPIGLRMIFYRMFNAPLIGGLLVAVLSNFVMMQTFSVKSPEKALDAGK